MSMKRKPRSKCHYYYVDAQKLTEAGISHYSTQKGLNQFRIVPFREEGRLHWRKEIWIHPAKGGDTETFLCPLMMFDEGCPLCQEYFKMLAGHKKEESPDKSFVHEKRFLMYVIALTNTGRERKGVRWLDAPKTVADGIIRVAKSHGITDADLSDSRRSYDVSFRRKGTSYTRDSFRLGEIPNPEKRHPPMPSFERFLKPVDGNAMRDDACRRLGQDPREKRYTPKKRLTPKKKR